MDVHDEFRSPGAEWRSAPFWSWNDRLEQAELRRQVREMAAAGMGGFFMHSRAGLLTPFLGEAWMESVATCIDEAERCGLNAWIYDEDRWPSGFAGGRYPAGSVEHRARQLVCVTLDDAAAFERPDGCTFARACRLEDGQPDGPVREVDALAGKGPVAVFHDAWQPPAPWFNDAHYTDLLNAEAVAGFAAAAYDPYDRFHTAFGSTIPGVFTDEPSHISQGLKSVPWTPNLPHLFRERYGHELVDALPHLFYCTGEHRRMRLQFYSLLADLFATSFTRQLNHWCRARGLKLTGHMLGEDSLAGSIRCAANPMRHYEEMDLPGVDHLGANIDLLLTMKQVSSAAQQLGRERVLCEIYGTSGWHMTLEQQKWIGDWEYALGVNLRCQHLCLYSMRGCRKRDYPPSIYFQQPWWPEYRRVEDYFARLGFMLTRGVYLSHVLVIHTQHSAYCEYAPAAAHEEVDELNGRLNDVARALCERRIGWHFGDESVMARHARLEAGELVVGHAGYDTVLIPPALTLCASTLDLLEAFAAAGGSIIAIEPTPTLLDGEPDERVQAFITTQCVVIDDTRATLDAVLAQPAGPEPRVISPSPALYAHVRRDGQRYIVFVCNTDMDAAHSGTVTMARPARFERWDLETGEIDEVAVETDAAQGETSTAFTLPPAGSLLLIADPAARPSDCGVRLESPETRPVRELNGPWRCERLDPNVLVLDYCRYGVADEPWSDRVPVWKAQHELRTRLGLPSLRFNDGVSLWKLAEQGRDRVDAPLSLELQFEFESGAAAAGCQLLIETPQIYDVRVNGSALDRIPDADRPWRVDPCMRLVPLAGPLLVGRNELVLACDYTGEQELETIFLLGAFGVSIGDGGPAVTEPPETIELGDWTGQGHPFYVGTMAYETEFELSSVPRGLELAVEFDGATVCRLIVNGRPCATLWHRPWAAPIATVARPGRNTARIELVTTLHNAFGPHHYDGQVVTQWVDARKFSDEAHWNDAYALVPSGLRSATLRVPGRP
jgi:hypothetical protein